LVGLHPHTDVNARVETLKLGMTHIDNRTGGPVGIAAKGQHRALAVLGLDTYLSVGYIIAHEMGHCFGLRHPPSPGADYLDWDYPYGGAGMSGGWGYIDIVQPEDAGKDPIRISRFFAEDDHAPENTDEYPAWDFMAYKGSDYGWLGEYGYVLDGLSSYHSRKLLPNFRDAAPPSGPNPSFRVSQLPGVKRVTGTNIYIFGNAAAAAAQAAMTGPEKDLFSFSGQASNAPPVGGGALNAIDGPGSSVGMADFLAALDILAQSQFVPILTDDGEEIDLGDFRANMGQYAAGRPVTVFFSPPSLNAEIIE
jgi:hypothetical protein